MEILNKQIDVDGLVVSPGIAIGNVCHYQSGSNEQTAIYKINPAQAEDELLRLEVALTESKNDIQKLLKNIEDSVGKNEAKIFETHILLLEDPQLLDKIKQKVVIENLNIEYAVKSVFEEFEEIFDNMTDDYLKERKIDFYELKKRLLSHLSGDQGKFLCKHQCLTLEKEGRIILTKELTPSMISLLENNNIFGFITQNGGKNSHAALIARAIGIPYITGINIIDKIKCETKVIIDGNSNKVIFNPSDEVYDYYSKLQFKEKQFSQRLLKEEAIIKTGSGKEIYLYASIINIFDMENIKKFNFSGIGLVRTEFLFMNHKEFPTEEEQFNTYSEIVKKNENKETTFRLFDFGGDKKIQSLRFKNEENPLLGLRGIRYLLKHNKILKDQIRAIVRCRDHGKIKILYPMICTVKELDEVNSIIKEITDEANVKEKIKTGMMFEVPSVFIEPEKYIKNIDFVSIGSNDLIQYLFGVDRNNFDVSYLYNQDNTAVYKLIHNLIKAIAKEKKEVMLCGEVDLNTDFLENIIKLGINKISISPLSAPKIIERIKKIKLQGGFYVKNR